jgi:2-haloacid dehalogenase
MNIPDRSHSMPYVFDAYGTLFDFNAAVARHRAAIGPDADRFAEMWRQKQIEYTWNHTLTGNYLNFWTLTQRALDYCLERFPAVDHNLRPALLDAYYKLDAYPDAQSVLRELKARGERCAILTNGSPDMVGAAVEGAGLKDLLEAVLSVDAVKMFKTRPETYMLVTKHFACKPADVVFVSSNRWDAFGSTAFGFRTVWVNRASAPDEYPDHPPASVVSSLTGLLSAKV